jgi:Kef-type K+ transport system membrane component KefB
MSRLFRNTEELEKLSELGVLFLLFEMGLELSLDRLKVLLNLSYSHTLQAGSPRKCSCMHVVNLRKAGGP